MTTSREERAASRLRYFTVAVTVSLVACAALRLAGVELLGRSELWASDIFVRHGSAEHSAHERIVVVEIDDHSLAQMGERWPFARNTWANFLLRLDTFAPKVVALNVLFDQQSAQQFESLEQVRANLEASRLVEPSRREELLALFDQTVAQADGDRALANAMAQTGNTVQSVVLSGTQAVSTAAPFWAKPLPGPARTNLRVHGATLLGNLPQFAASARASGFLNIVLDVDGKLRRYPLVGLWRGKLYPSLAMAAVIAANPKQARALAQRTSSMDRGAPLLHPVDGSSFVRVSFSDVLSAAPGDPFLRRVFRDRIVFVGVTATGIGARKNLTRASRVADVEVHAMAADNLLSRSHLTTEGGAAWVGLVLTALVLGLFCLIVSMPVRPSRLAAIALLLLVLYLSAGWFCAIYSQFLLMFLPVPLGLATMFAQKMTARYAAMARHREEVMREKQVAEEKEAFVSVISHELRTPITSIHASLRLLLGGALGRLPSAAQELIAIASSNSDRLVRLVSDLLDMQKAEAGLLELRPEIHDLSALLGKTLAENRAYAERLGVSLEMSSPGALWVSVDWDRISQVVTNLISNASKFSPEGETVRVVAEKGGDSVRVSVHNRGVGVPHSFRSQMFQRFAQSGGPSRGPRGSGLGLCISKSIIDQHAGRIDFVSEPELGTTFFFEIPLCSDAASPTR